MKETTKNRPCISAETRDRITTFVREVQRLQDVYGVAIAILPSDVLGFRDLRRKDNWNGYGEFDAMIYNADTKRVPIKADGLKFESFSLWGK